ncbi:MAG: rhomboid family intramembrane serine protease [Myxococcota bacterium]
MLISQARLPYLNAMPSTEAPEAQSTPSQPEAAIAELPLSRRRRQAEESLLVLTAEGVDAQIVRSLDGFGLSVAPEDLPRSAEILRAWQAERRERAEKPLPPKLREASTFEFAMAYLCALSMLAFHLGLQSTDRWERFVQLGDSQAALVLHGQLYRLCTALTLHADLSHVLGNTLFGGFFLAALSGRLGVGLGLLSFVVAGTLGNLANAVYYTSSHSSIGASTGVFGLVGVLAGLAAWHRHHFAPRGRGAWVALGAGLAIVAMLGAGGPRVDFSAHLFGLVAGALTGVGLAFPLAHSPRPGPLGQGLAGTLAFGILAASWYFALRPA